MRKVDSVSVVPSCIRVRCFRDNAVELMVSQRGLARQASMLEEKLAAERRLRPNAKLLPASQLPEDSDISKFARESGATLERR